MARFGEINAQYFDDAGDPLSSGKIYFYETGTTALKDTFSDINQTIANTNPVILTAAGRQPNIFFSGTAKAILVDKNDVQILVRDPVGQTASVFGDGWVATKIYSADAVVLGSDGQYYRSLAAGNQNNDPTSTSGYWTLLYSVEWNAGITYQVGAVVSYNNIQYQSLQNSNLNNNPSSATAYWASIAFAWLSTRTYAINENVVGTDGILYTSLQNSNTGNVPASSPSYWVGTSAAAAASATAAATSATAAATSATNAATSETNAGNSATAAATSATNAATSATNSANSATASATSATNSATSATASANSATAAASSATDAANKYDEFDDRYLGQKSSDPSTDNDGNALVTGAIYFNTTTNVMRVYNGSAWQNVAPTATSITLSQVTDVTATAAEVNLNDGSVAGTVVNGKTVVYGASGEVNATTLQLSGTAITSTAAELNLVDGSSAGTIANSKAVIYGSSGEVNATTLQIAGTSITSTAAELNLLDGVTATTAEINYLDGVTSNIQTQFDSISGTPLVQSFTANGAIASGKPVILETAGTVAQVATTTINPVAPIGSRTLVDGNNTEYLSIAADPFNENRWVACYSDDIGNKDLFMRVFTRSGTTITQSSAISLVTGGSSNRDVCVCFDKAQENVVLLMYNNNNNDGVVRVATISGSAGSESVTLGSETSFYTPQPIFTANQKGCINLVNYDTSGNFLGIWIDANNSPTEIRGRVFQVSGTSVTAGGSTVDLATDSSNYSTSTRAIREHYSDNTKVYFAYRDSSSKVAMKVLTMSGTSISVGTKYQSTQSIDEQGISISPISDTKIIVSSAQNSQNYPGYHLVTDSGGTLSYGTWTVVSSVSSRMVIALNNKNNNQLVFPFYYSYTSGSLFPFVKILTSNSDGSTITFSTENQLESSNAIANSFNGLALQEDSSGHYLLLGEYSSDLYRILGKTGGDATNLTSTNYIGIAEAAISDTASGNIMLRGGVSEKVSSLTAGSTYYVQADGTFATSAGSPSVEAGKALSATKLLLKGL